MSTKDYFKFFTTTSLTGNGQRDYLMSVEQPIDAATLKQAFGNVVSYFDQYGDGFQFTSPFSIEQLETVVTEQTTLKLGDFKIVNRAGLHGIGNGLV